MAIWSLIGWLADLPALTTFFAGRPALSPMTAVFLMVLAGASVALPRRRTAAFVLGAVVTVAGASIVMAQLMSLPQSEWIPQAWWSSRFTGMLFLLTGCAAVLLSIGRVAAGQVVAFCALMFAALLALGHAFPSADLYTYLPGTGVAVPTVLALAALALSLLLACRDAGIAGALTSRNAAGGAGLRLLLSSLAAVALLTMGVLAAQRQEIFDTQTAVLLLAWCALGILGVALWGFAIVVDRAEGARLAAEQDRDLVRQMVAAAVTHDLRTPLAAAMLSTTLLERLVDTPKALTSVHRLQRSHRRLDRLLRSLLDSIALERGGGLNIRSTFFALNGLLDDVIAENHGALAERVEATGAAEGWWDRDALFRVVENLLLNAVKYGAAVSPIHCRIVTEQDHVVLQVENSGPPIPEAEWETIFEPFTRGEGTGRDDIAGWGVGLAYARLITAQHGGSIRVSASTLQSTIFEVRLPLNTPPAQLAATPLP